MNRVTLPGEDDFDAWRDAARHLVEAGIPPSAIAWQVAGGESDLFGTEAEIGAAPALAVPRAFVQLAQSVICHSDPERFALLYAMLWRLRTDRRAMEDPADPLLHRLDRLAKEVRRDIHKMHAFVRFRPVHDGDAADPLHVAWFEPEQRIVEANAPWFRRRFANMRWAILTPERCVEWDGSRR